MNDTKFRFKIITNACGTNTSLITTDFINNSMTENKYIIPLIALLNHKNYNVKVDFYGSIDFEDGSDGVHYTISFPKLILDKTVKEINVQNFPFDIWKIKIEQIEENDDHKPIRVNSIDNPKIENNILYKPEDSDEIAGYIKLYMTKNCIEEKEFNNVKSDIKEYTDYIYYILDKYNSGIRKLYDWAASLE